MQKVMEQLDIKIAVVDNPKYQGEEVERRVLACLEG